MCCRLGVWNAFILDLRYLEVQMTIWGCNPINREESVYACPYKKQLSLFTMWLSHFLFLSTMYKSSICSTFLSTLGIVNFLNLRLSWLGSNISFGLFPIFLITNENKFLFVCFLCLWPVEILCYFFEDWAVFLTEMSEFSIYSEYMSFVRYMHYKKCLSILWLVFSFC